MTDELLPMDVDPWDETPVTVPRGLLALLLNAAGKADEAELLGKCPSDPCPTCTALVEIHEAVYPTATCCCRGLIGNTNYMCMARGLDLDPPHCGDECPERPACIEANDRIAGANNE